jgi:long-chain acyl-CoA synthetase
MTETTVSAAPDVHAESRRTIGRLWLDAVAEGRERPAYLVEDEPGAWRAVSWPEAARAVDELAHGLLSLGVRKGDAFGLLASTRLEWVLFDFALGLVGAIGAPVYASSSPRDCAYVLEHAEAVGVLAEDEEQRAKVTGVALEHVLTFGDLDDLRARGREHAGEHPRAVQEAAAAVGDDDLFTYIYTSGTTGPPKACMIRHRNYHAMVEAALAIEDWARPDDVMLLYLPLAHNFGRLMHLQNARAGITTAFCPDPYRVREALKQVRPTILPSVPRVYEKIHATVVARFDELRGPRRRLAEWALAVGRRASPPRQRGERLHGRLALEHRLADRLVYSKVKKELGGRLRVGISGGAPLAKEIAEFFHALDLLILEGWGQTECTTAATVNRPGRFRFGTVGLAMPNVELDVAEDGEVLVRTPTIFAGYYKDPEATGEVLAADGWLRTGDVGELDADGFLTLTDRKKDIIVTAGGKNVAPQNLENALKGAREISQALVVGDRRPYLVALVTLDPEATSGIGGEEEVRRRVQAAVDGVNADLSRFEQIKRFAILPRDFSAAEGELTPTLKLKRRVCEEHFAAELEALYS